MTDLVGATGRHFAAAAIGSGAHADTDVVRHFISCSEVELEARVNAHLDEITDASHYIYALHLAGSGDGGKFCVTATSGADGAGGVVPAPPLASAPGSRVFFYKGETPASLQQQYLQARARMRAWLEEDHNWEAGDYVDHQIAGAAQGAVIMGMILMYRYDR